MGRKTGVSIYGLESLGKKLRSNAELKDVQNAVKLNVAEMQKSAEFYAPVDTGNLKREIDVVLDTSLLAGKIVSRAEYSGYVEYGTRFQSAQPFMYPAFKEQVKLFKKDLKRLVE